MSIEPLNVGPLLPPSVIAIRGSIGFREGAVTFCVAASGRRTEAVL
ncbi:hypothetical protein GOP80_07500 [Planococcaceae bacterium Storch 2/2-2]|nr:hypothetical protein [Planococcaceae bacterium Storch 2/2-2]